MLVHLKKTHNETAVYKYLDMVDMLILHKMGGGVVRPPQKVRSTFDCAIPPNFVFAKLVCYCSCACSNPAWWKRPSYVWKQPLSSQPSLSQEEFRSCKRGQGELGDILPWFHWRGSQLQTPLRHGSLINLLALTSVNSPLSARLQHEMEAEPE